MRWTLAVAMAFGLGSMPRAEASWAICVDTLAGAAITAKTELEAKQMALADWVDKAGVYGVAFTRWQLAWNRQLTCAPTGEGHVRCVAHGRPCRISQTPPPAGQRDAQTRGPRAVRERAPFAQVFQGPVQPPRRRLRKTINKRHGR